MARQRERAAALVEELRTMGSERNVEGMARFGIRPAKPLGVPMPKIRRLARAHERDHELALALWATGYHEARILASIVADPARTTPATMDGWIASFDSWDVCDQCCMNLFEKTPHAWGKVVAWSKREPEFEKRAGLALAACLAWHRKEAPDAKILRMLPSIRRGAADDRASVWKAASWALRQIGKRGGALREAALGEARAMAASDVASTRRVGKETLRALA